MRTICITEKLKTAFGSVFTHVDVTPDGSVQSIGFSVQGRMKDSTIGNALDALSDSVNEMIGEAALRAGKQE